MAFTESALVLWIPVDPRKWRLFLVVFLVRMWRLNACERLRLPLPRTRKRLAAPLLVFILGMTVSLFAAHGGALRRRGFFARWLTGLGLVGVIGFRYHFFRSQQHHHLPTLESRKLLDLAIGLQVATNTFQQANAEFLMGHLAPTVSP